MTTPQSGAAAPVPGSPEYNASMAAAAESVQLNTGNALPQGTGEEPKGELEGATGGKKYGGKYDTIEELEAAFAELQSGKKPEEGNAEGETQNVTEEEVKNATEEQAADALKSVGLEMDAFSREFGETGGLSDQSYQKLADAGIPKEMVDAYIEGRMAVVDQAVTEITSVVGGKENYQTMVNWAKTNMSPAEIAAYDEVVSDGNVYTAKLAAEGLYRRYIEANGTNNRPLGGSTSGVATDLFQSTAQVTSAMADPRYKADPAYRREVAEKLARSGIF